jgi:hypothetical protein
MVEQFNEFLCPFCQRSNACGAKSDAPCWCFQEPVPKDLLALLPQASRNKACVCQLCINAFQEDPESFRKNLESI